MPRRHRLPEEVFTPRSAAVNTAMYVERPELEQALRNGLKGSLHLVLHGESGTGKSWLYKKVLADEKAHVSVANLANASRMGSISAELENLVQRSEQATKTSYSETKETEFSAVIASGGLKHEGHYQLGAKEPFERFLRFAREDAGSRAAAVLVLDNLEAAYSDNRLLKELADIIILLDDTRYAEYRVKMLIVGVPAHLREYYVSTPTLGPVANRLRELPEVTRLTKEQAEEFLYRGFVEQLGYELPDEDFAWVTKHTAWVTDRVPQRLHEYCLELALVSAENRRAPAADLLNDADARWLRQSLYSAYTVIDTAMNERQTKIGRRNQTLVALGMVRTDEFRWNDIEAIVKQKFPRSSSGARLNIPQQLSALAAQERPVIKRSPKGDGWVFTDPMYRMCMRAMLRVDEDEAVRKIEVANM